MTPAVELLGVRKTFPGVVALDGVDLALAPGRVHALVGENGAGKSTLIHLLGGNHRPDAGEIRVAGSRVHFAGAADARAAGIVTVYQEVDLFDDLSAGENLGLLHGLPANRLGWIDWREQRRLARAALDALGERIPLSVPASALSPGRRQLLEIAAAVSHEARVLILDEPTSSLSAEEARVLFEQVRRFRSRGAAVLYVSHRLEEVFALADDLTVLRDGRRVWTGPIAATSPAEAIRAMVGREVATATLRRSAERGAVRFRCEDVAGVSLEVRGGEILGLYGLVGAGRSEWAQACFGVRRRAGGRVWVDGARVRANDPEAAARAGLAYVPEDRLRQGACRGLSVTANAVLAVLRRLAVGPWLPGGRESTVAKRVIERLNVRTSSPATALGTLSGGNQQKVIVGRWLERNPAVLIVDEPTRGIDVGAKAEVHALLRTVADDGRAVVLISSDLPEVLAHADRVGVFREGALVRTFEDATAEAVAAEALPQQFSRERSASALPALAERSRPNGVRLPRELVLFALTAALVAFLPASAIREVATVAALASVAAVGVAIVILAGGIDISLGALMALCGAVAGKLWEDGTPLPVALAVAVAIGAAGGTLNAGLTLVGRVHPIVVTLGTMSVYRGLTLRWLTQNVQVPGERRDFLFADALGLPLVVWLSLGLLLVLALAFERTLFGRYVYAVGGNPSAARRFGLNPSATWLKAYALQGALVGLAAILYLARTGGQQAAEHEERTLEAIAAAVVGGIAITGGRGRLLGVALGCVLLAAIAQTARTLDVPSEWRKAIVGAALAVAVATDALTRRASA